jgi:hypothetical protein
VKPLAHDVWCYPHQDYRFFCDCPIDRAFATVDWFEHRDDRSYDEQDGACLILANGTKVVSFHRGFIGAAAKYALQQHAKAA